MLISTKDCFKVACETVKSLLPRNSSTNSHEVSEATEQPPSPSANSPISVAPENQADPGLQRAENLRCFADKLHILLSSGKDHEPNWDDIHSTSKENGCQSLIQGFEHIVDMLSSQGNVPEPDAGIRGTQGKEQELAQEGKKVWFGATYYYHT